MAQCRFRTAHRLDIRLFLAGKYPLPIPARLHLRHRHPPHRLAQLTHPQRAHPATHSVLPSRDSRVRHYMEVKLGPSTCLTCCGVFAARILRSGREPPHNAWRRKCCGRDQEKFYVGCRVCCILCREHSWPTVGEEPDEGSALPRIVDGAHHMVSHLLFFCNILMI